MAIIVNINVNIDKLDARKMHRSKNGDRNIGLSLIIKDEPDKFGNDCSVWERQREEEYHLPKNYCGQGKIAYVEDRSINPKLEKVKDNLEKRGKKIDKNKNQNTVEMPF